MQVKLNFLDEIIVDSFAGGGGASTGIELALGRAGACIAIVIAIIIEILGWGELCLN